MTTPTTPHAKDLLDRALHSFVHATGDAQIPQVLYKLQYEQLGGSDTYEADGPVFTLPTPSFSLSFDDATLEPVHEAWKRVMGDAAVESEYLTFEDREGAMDDEDEVDE